jgi:hypothetical protein
MGSIKTAGTYAVRSGAVVKVAEQVGDVVLLEAKVAGGRLIQVAGNVAKEGGTLFLRKVHIEGAAPGELGIKGLFDLIRDFGKANDAAEVIVQGARRTTGIGKIKGSIPRPIRVKIGD